MKNTYVTFIIFLFSSFFYAQIEEDSKRKIKNSYITVHTTTLLHTYTPRFRVGYIQRLNNRISLGVDTGFGSKNTAFAVKSTRTSSEYDLLEIRPQLYYFFFGKGTGVSYVSGEVYFINHTDRLEEDTFVEDGVYFNFDKADFQSKNLGLNIIFGVFTNSKKRLGLNIYLGAGFGFETNTHTNIINLEQLEEKPFQDTILFELTERHPEEGTRPVLNITAGVKINFRLKNTNTLN